MAIEYSGMLAPFAAISKSFYESVFVRILEKNIVDLVEKIVLFLKIWKLNKNT